MAIGFVIVGISYRAHDQVNDMQSTAHMESELESRRIAIEKTQAEMDATAIRRVISALESGQEKRVANDDALKILD
jgi:hypothetical protein